MRIQEKFKKIILLSNNESHVVWDQKTLQRMGFERLRVFKHASKAVDYLNKNHTDLIICDADLEDMSGLNFLSQLWDDMNRIRTPRIMVTTENREKRVLDAIHSGCTGYVLRPYSIVTMEKHLKQAREIEAFVEEHEKVADKAEDLLSDGEIDAAIAAYNKVLDAEKELEDADYYYREGCTSLVKGKYGKAISAFRKALKVNGLFAKAYHGLADAFEAKGDDFQAQEYLGKGVELHAELNELDEAKKLFIRILQRDEQAENPFQTLAEEQMAKGDVKGAVRSYKQAAHLMPHDERVVTALAKTLALNGDTDDAVKAVTKALEINGEYSEALELYSEITGKLWRPAFSGHESSGILDTNTLLDDL